MHDRILYRDHGEAKRREEGLSTEEVRKILEVGLVLRRYPEDQPFSSYLVLGWIAGPARLGTYEKGRPIHVVAADDDENQGRWIITIYEPNLDKWTDQFIPNASFRCTLALPPVHVETTGPVVSTVRSESYFTGFADLDDHRKPAQ